MRKVVALCALALIAATIVVVGDGSGPVRADHGDDSPPVLLRDRTEGPYGMVVGALPNLDGSPTGIPAIARNLVVLGRGSASKPLQVCAEKYQDLTEKAVAVWNDSLEAMTGNPVKALTYVTTCPTPDANPADGYSVSIKVRSGNDCGNSPCALTDGMYIVGDPWYAYYGQGEVAIPRLVGSDRKKVATIAHEIGHLLGFAHPYQTRYDMLVNGLDFYRYHVTKCPGALEYEELELRGATRLFPTGRTYTSAAAVPYFSAWVKSSLAAVSDSTHGGALMLPTSVCKGDVRKSASRWEYEVGEPRLRTYDQQAYESAYGPGKVTDVKVASAAGGKVSLTWTASHMHVEKHFAVQAKVHYSTVGDSGDGWVSVATAAANTTGVTFAQPRNTTAYRVITTATSHATYRVVSVTDAFGRRAPQASAISAEVAHKKVTHELNVTHGRNGTVLPESLRNKPTQHAKGAKVEITARPNSGYVVKSWSATDPSANHASVSLSACSTPAATCRSVTMNGPRRVHVTFKAGTTTPPPPPPKTYTFTVKATGGGSVSGGGSGYAYNALASATAKWNNATHSFEGWSGACTHKVATCSTYMTRDKSATAAFKERTKVCPSYTLTATATGGGNASGGTFGGSTVKITASCPTVTGTATATWTTTSHTFSGWSGCTSVSTTTGKSTCSVTPMTANKTVTATFKKQSTTPPPTPTTTLPPTPTPETKCLVTVKSGPNGSAGGGGTVTCGKGTVTIWARAGTGYCFQGWTPVFGRNAEEGQNAQTCTRSSSTRVSPTVDITYTANFRREAPIYYKLVVVGGAGGGSYKAGTWATATASAGRCFLGKTYTFKRWSGDASGMSRSVRIYMSRNKSVTAIYTVGGDCQLSEESVGVDDGGGPAWTEAPETEPADGP